MFTHPWGVAEDDLTGDFFGLMKYLPPDLILLPFLDLIQSLYPDRDIHPGSVERAEVLLWPEYEIPREWRDEFNRPDIPPEKRRSKYYIAPDAVIRLNECALVVEAEKSHSVEAEQLFQQYLVGRREFLVPDRGNRRLFILLINTDQLPPHSCHVTAPDKETGLSISPSDPIPQYIEKRARMVGETCSQAEIRRSFLWVSWHHIGKLAEELLDRHGGKESETSKVVCPLLRGFKEMMDKEGFYPVRKFRADDPNEVRVAENASRLIPRISTLPDCAGFPTDSEGKIEPSFVPGFHLLGDPAGWLAQQSIQYEAISVLGEGGDHGDRRAD